MSIQLSAARGRRTMDSYINSKAETRKSRASGMVTGVITDTANMLTRATVNLSGASISVPVPFGMSVYEGMNVQLSNHGSSSQANWQITGTAVPAGITGGTITNPSGAITQIFDNIWVRNNGFVMIGGDIDLEGNPVGPRIVGTSCGLKGYNEHEEVSLALYSSHCDDRNPGDSIFGLLGGPHVEILPEVGEVGIYNGTEAVLLFSQNGNFIRHPLTIGDPIGSRFNIGEIDDKATFVIRNKFGVAKLVARTDDNGGVYFHVGNPPPQGKSFYFDEDANELVVSGKIIMEEGEVAGRLDFRSTGSFMIADPDDPSRYGMITPRGIYSYSVDGQGQQYLNSVDAWGPLTLESRGVTKTWLAGEMMRGDANYRHFRSERGAGGRTGLFNGDTPVVYIDYAGNGFFTGTINFGASNVIDAAGMRMDATRGKFSSASVEWLDGLDRKLSIGTVVDLGAVTGAYIETPVGLVITAPDVTIDGHTAFNQSNATAAVPVLTLSQADVSEDMIEFSSTAGTGNAIEAVGSKTLTTTHFIKVTVNGAVRYIPVGTIA